MESTVAVIADLKGNTLCTLSTTKYDNSFVNGYPFSTRHAENLKPYINKQVIVSVGHVQPIPKETRELKEVIVGGRITKVYFK